MTPTYTAFESARQAQTDQAGLDVQSSFASLSHAKLSPEAKEKKLREACEGFESIFIQKMWQEMRKSVHQSTLLHSREEQFWQDMYDQELAKKMTSAGGIGLADMMFEQLSSHLTHATRATALTTEHERTFIPSQAPLLTTEELAKPESLAIPGTPIALYERVPQETVSEPSSDTPKPSFAPHTGSPAAAQETNQPTQAPQASQAPQTQPTHNTGNRTDAWLSGVTAQTPMQTPMQTRGQTTTSRDPVESALATLRSRVEVGHEKLAQVSYAEPHRRQQPVASGLELAQAARRQAGDQLGSRGVREPLLPQTARARAETAHASTRQEPEPAVLTERSLLPETPHLQQQPLPYSFPRTQAQMQNDALTYAQMGRNPSSEAFVQQSSLLPSAPASAHRQSRNERRVHQGGARSRARQDNRDTIKTLNLSSKPSQREAAREAAQFARDMRPLLTPGQTPQTNSYVIPPLTSGDLQKS